MFALDHLRFVGHGLSRPECVLCTCDGALHVADWRGGVSVIGPDGHQRTVLAHGGFTPKPNGIAILPDGGWLLAHLGDTDGGIYRLAPDGELSPHLVQVAGTPLPPTNYVHIDGQGRVWVTVSTRRHPRSLGYRPDCDDGFIVLLDKTGARIVADGLGYTNECLIHPETGQLYVNETFARRLTRFDVDRAGNLTNRTTVAAFGVGTYPDGLTFDAEGGVLITSIISNRVIRVAPDGHQEILLQDADAEDLNHVERAFQAGELGRAHLDRSFGQVLRNISSAAFGGPDLRTLYLGCLLGDRLAAMPAPVAGLAPFHWTWTADRRETS